MTVLPASALTVPALMLSLIISVSGTQNCAPSVVGTLTVHLVCHTHDDVGWLKTVDQYFYGANNTIQRAGVQYIIDSVVDELIKDSSRKFSYVETAFFYRWWQQQTDDTKDRIKALVANGQLELVNGGWCMNDEAAANYQDVIDQMTLGLVFLNETFGKDARPRVAWQIDPFGHSSEQASLFAQMGFDGLFFGRLDYADKRKRWQDKEMEMVWQPSSSLGEAAWLFSGALPNGYNPPDGFCFDDLCGDNPIMDDPNLHDYNVEEKVTAFLQAVEDEAEAYRSNHIIMTMGSDFQYQNARTWYKNLDKLIKYVNDRQAQGSKVNVVYSTPSCYLDSVHADGLEWSSKTDDFFPYASDPHAYWTGYFTSRPTLKGYIRETGSYLQAVKQLTVLFGASRGPSIDSLAKALAVAQHHDAVSGTAKQHVTDDYCLRIAAAVEDASKDLLTTLRHVSRENKLTPRRVTGKEQEVEYSLCPNTNVSACIFTETKTSFQVAVYNTLSWPLSKYIRIPVPSNTAYKVTDYQGNGVPSQLVPLPSVILELPNRNSTATQELVFLAAGVPPLGFLTFVVNRTESRAATYSSRSRKMIVRKGGKDLILRHGPLSVTLDGATSLLKAVSVHTSSGIQTETVQHELLWYAGMAGDNSESDLRASGAYIFRPNNTEPYPVGSVETVVYQGELTTEIQQQWGTWASQVLRIYKGIYYIEADWLIGPIPISDGIGKEVITRYTLFNMTTNGTFYTDANGREMKKRVVNHRDTWQLNVTEPIAGNYYPVTSRIILRSTDDTNGTYAFAVLNDRSQGGSSLTEGQLELMLHRRLLHDDSFGVGEPLNETAYGQGLVARGTHLLVFSDMTSPSCDFTCTHRVLGTELLHRPLVVYQGEGASPAQAPWSGLTDALPLQVHVLTLEPWFSDTENVTKVLLRLEHLFEEGESMTYSTPVTIDLQTLLKDWSITSARETVLSANQWLDESQRLQWTVTKGNHLNPTSKNNPTVKADESKQKMNNLAGKFAPWFIRRPVRSEYDNDDENIEPVHEEYSYGDENQNLYGYSHDDVIEEINGRFPSLHSRNQEESDLTVTLQPMQIRTFIVTVEPRQEWS